MKYTREIIENLLNNKITLNVIFTLDRCESCDIVKAELDRRNIEIDYVRYEDNKELAKDFDFSSFPTLLQIKNGGYKYYQGFNFILDKLIKKVDDSELKQE